MHRPIKANLQVCSSNMIIIFLGGLDVMCMRHSARHVGNAQNVNCVNKKHSKGNSDGKLYDKVGG